MANVSILCRTFATRSSACVGPVDQHFAPCRPLPLPALRMVRTLGKAGMKSIARAGAPMELKNAHVEVRRHAHRLLFPSSGWALYANAKRSWSQ